GPRGGVAHDRRAARRGDDGRRPPGPGDGQGDPTVIGARERAHLTPSGDLLPGPGGPRDITIRPYTQHWRWPLPRRDERLIDPLNLLLLGTSPGEAMAALGAQGWRRPDDGAVHVLWIGHRRRRMSDHTALGTRAARVHVRLWAVPAGTLAAAHDETLAGERHVVR